MSLQVIGAGFGRTGTASMKRALEMLGFGPCHHMFEVNGSPEQVEVWRAIAAGATPDWRVALRGYRSCVDWPAAFFWRELAEAFPEAKVLLTVRDADAWYASVQKTILPHLLDGSPESVGRRLIGERVFGGRADDPAHAKAVFEANTAAVTAAIAPERLLVYRPGDGWEPLCGFLGVPVPDALYPHTNRTEEFVQRASEGE